MSRVALYVRVSTEEQNKHGLSVDSQIQALREYAKDNNHVVVGLYNDAGISARKSYLKRPALLNLLEDCKANKIDLILFTKLDRWFRSVADYYEVQKILEASRVCWRSIWEDYETETANGIFKVNIMLSVAQSESDRTKERIKSVFDYKRSLGQVCTGGVSTGYVIKNKRWYIDKEIEPAIRAYFDTYLKTYSIKMSSLAYEEIAGVPISPSVAGRLLRKPCYWGGEPYVAEAYITEEQHKIIEPTLKKKGRERVYHHLFNGLIYCKNCGGMLTPSTIRPDRSQYHCRYFCAKRNFNRSCIGSSIREEFLEQYLLDNIEKELSDYTYDVNIKAKNDKISNDIKKAKARLDRIKNLYELGDMDFNVYKQKRALLYDEIAQLENMITGEQVVELPDNWREIYDSLDNDHKKIFWGKLIKRVEISDHMSKTPVIYF